MRFAQTRALIAKELAQHRRTLIGLSALLAVFWVVGWLTFLRGARGVSVLEVLPGYLMLALPAAAVVLGHHLVVTEYYGRTQRFLEALPLRRSAEALVKASFGLVVVAFWALGAFVATAALALAHEPLEARFILILTARIAGFAFATWGCVFLFSVFGRLRLPLLLGIAIVLGLIAQTTEISLGNWGPLALVHPSTFPVERSVFPRAALLAALALGAASFALALALVRVREGSIIESLARPLALREKAALFVVVAGGLVVLSVAEKRKLVPMPAVQKDEQQVLHAGSLEIAYLDDALRGPAQRLAASLTPLLDAVAQVLPPPRPRLRVVEGSDVPPERPQVASVHARQGVVVRANLSVFAPPVAPAGHAARAVADLLHAVIFVGSGRRVFSEPRHWLLDGFTLYLATRGLPGAPHADPDPMRDLALDGAVTAAYASGFSQPTARDLAAYFVMAEQLGEFPAAALAASGWIYLEEIHPERIWPLARAAFLRRGTDDLRDLIDERLTPMPRLWQDATGTSWEEFLTGWRAWLQERATRPALAARLARLPRATIAIDVAAQGADAVSVRGHLANSPAGIACAALHRREPWFDTGPQPELLDEDRLPLTRDRDGTGHDFTRALEGDYDSGERVFVAVDCSSAQAPFGVRLFSGRVTVP
jgi:hypothetical protein